MAQQLKIRDHVNARPAGPAWLLDWSSGVPVTLRTLIAERVRLEYDRNADQAMPAAIRLIDAPKDKAIDVEDLIAQAIRGFEKNAFIALVDWFTAISRRPFEFSNQKAAHFGRSLKAWAGGTISPFTESVSSCRSAEGRG